MQTIKLWLEPDADIPEFQQLAYEVVEVDIQDVLEHGIHPWSDHHTNRTLTDRFLHLLNTPECKLKQLAELQHCGDITTPHNPYEYGERGSFEALLKYLNRTLRFVDTLDYTTLLGIAVRKLKASWNHSIAKTLAQSVCSSFNDIRALIKTKNKTIKLSSYSDIDRCDLGEVFCLEDFKSEDRLLVREGLAVTNFRQASFLNCVTDERGLLRFAPSIDHFQLQPVDDGQSGYWRLTYRGHREGKAIRLVPIIRDDASQRSTARRVAEQWRVDEGKYCFTTSMAKLRDMLMGGHFQISFPNLDYQRKPEPPKSTAQIHRHEVQRFVIGRYLTSRDPGDAIKEVLRRRGVSMTGTKDQLAHKLAALSVRLYRKHQHELALFFGQHRFVRTTNTHARRPHEFPVLHDVDQRDMLLTMYATRHLRGNTILDPNHTNDTYDLLPLAQSLIRGEISVSGAFIKIEE